MSHTPIDFKRIKVQGKGNHNKHAGEINGYLKYQENKSNHVEKNKVFVATNDEKEATIFARYKSKIPSKTGYFYAVHGSDDGDGTALWLDETTSEGIVYANRRSYGSVLGFTGNVHSWKLNEDGSKSRLQAILGVDIHKLTNESLAFAKQSQNEINKDNGGKEVFCNIKYKI